MHSLTHKYYTDSTGDLIVSGYTPENVADSHTAILWFQGALGAGDMGERTFPEIAIENNISFFYPDYYGNFRGGREFTIDNCAQTVLDTITALKEGQLTTVHHGEHTPFTHQYQNILCAFSSFAGWIPWWIHEHMGDHQHIGVLTNIAWQCPFFDFKNQATADYPDEEAADEFLFLGTHIFGRSYRGLEKPEWDAFLRGQSEHVPMDNLEKLGHCTTSIVHGASDTVIYPIKSENLHQKLRDANSGSHQLHVLKGVGHGGGDMEQLSITHFLEDFKLI